MKQRKVRITLHDLFPEITEENLPLSLEDLQYVVYKNSFFDLRLMEVGYRRKLIFYPNGRIKTEEKIFGGTVIKPPVVRCEPTEMKTFYETLIDTVNNGEGYSMMAVDDCDGSLELHYPEKAIIVGRCTTNKNTGVWVQSIVGNFLQQNGIDGHLSDEGWEALMEAETRNKAKNGLLFSYELSESRGPGRQKIEVFDTDEGNIHLDNFPGFYDSSDPDDFFDVTKHLEKHVIDEIRKIIETNDWIFDLGEIEWAPVKDGVRNHFIFTLNDRVKEIETGNLGFFRSKDRLNYIKNEPVNAPKLIRLFDKIRKVLVDAGIDPRFLKLN